MILVLLEVTIQKECMDEYLALAAELKCELEKSPGFLRSERFCSLANEGKLLSLSVWESEEAVDIWRNTTEHRMRQLKARQRLFQSYTITVASPLRRYGMQDRAQAPQDSDRFFSAPT